MKQLLRSNLTSRLHGSLAFQFQWLLTLTRLLSVGSRLDVLAVLVEEQEHDDDVDDCDSLDGRLDLVLELLGS